MPAAQRDTGSMWQRMFGNYAEERLQAQDRLPVQLVAPARKAAADETRRRERALAGAELHLLLKVGEELPQHVVRDRGRVVPELRELGADQRLVLGGRLLLRRVRRKALRRASRRAWRTASISRRALCRRGSGTSTRWRAVPLQTT